MQTPVEIDFQGMSGTPEIHASIEKHVAELEQRYGRVTACRVVLKGPGGHHRTGGLYEVNIFHDFHCPPRVRLGCPVHQVSYYSVAEGDRRSIVGKIHSAQVFGVFAVPNYEVVAGHLLPRAQRPTGFIAQPDWRGLCRIAQCYGSSSAGAGPAVAPPCAIESAPLAPRLVVYRSLLIAWP